MGADSKIEWTDATFNPWIGCTEVSHACDLCYARELAKRYGWAKWGNEPRHRTSKDYWRQPIAWNKKARAQGRRIRVFCASLADVFDNQVPPEWRADLFYLIANTPELDWLLLTKRPQNADKMIREALGNVHFHWPWSNVWLGCTVENQEEADRRIPQLLNVPAVVHFISAEPLLGPVDITRFLWGRDEPCEICPKDADCLCGFQTRKVLGLPSIDWVIVGGESGKAVDGKEPRPMHPQWARDLREQCAAANVAYLFKQWGEYAETDDPDDHELVGIDPEIAEHDCAFNTGEAAWMKRVGKGKSGRLLDGREHNEFPGLDHVFERSKAAEEATT